MVRWRAVGRCEKKGVVVAVRLVEGFFFLLLVGFDAVAVVADMWSVWSGGDVRSDTAFSSAWILRLARRSSLAVTACCWTSLANWH